MRLSVCLLREESGENGAAANTGQTLLLRAVQQRLCELASLHNESGQPLEAREIEARLLDGRPMVVLASAPSILSYFGRTVDCILPNESVRFLLSHPSCFVLFVYDLSRSSLDHELIHWISQSGAPDGVSPRHHNLASGSPLSWSFVCMNELLANGGSARIADMVDIWTLCAENAVFDPTGIRSFMLNVFNANRIPSSDDSTGSPQILPRYAAVVDDEEDVARHHAYCFRRLGYSTLPVYDHRGWAQISKGGAWRSKIESWDALMFDNYLNFSSTVFTGHQSLNFEFKAEIKIYITGMVDEDSSAEERVYVRKPIIDAADLVAKAKRAKESQILWDQIGEIVSSTGQSSAVAMHAKPKDEMRRVANELMEFSAKLEERRKGTEAALSYRDAYLAFRNIDESRAAVSLEKLQLLELSNISKQDPETLDPDFWWFRSREIRSALNSLFKGRDVEGRWWIARLFQNSERLMKENLAPGDLLAKVDASANWAMIDFQFRQERKSGHWVKWLNPLLWTKWSFRLFFALTNSPLRLMVAWTIFVAIFAFFYRTHSHCIAVPTQTPDLETQWEQWYHALLASVGCGLGIGMPQDAKVCLANDRHLLVGTFQRVFTLFFIAKILDLFTSRTRGRA